MDRKEHLRKKKAKNFVAGLLFLFSIGLLVISFIFWWRGSREAILYLFTPFILCIPITFLLAAEYMSKRNKIELLIVALFAILLMLMMYYSP